MRLFGFGKERKKEKAPEDSVWTPTFKEELKQCFCFPELNDEILVVDEGFHPVWYFCTYFYASAWEYYELGRSVSVFEENIKVEFFRESAKSAGDYHFEDTSFGTEADVVSRIEGLPHTLYTVSCQAFEDFVNGSQKIAWHHNGRELRAGDKVYVSRYIRDDGAEYRDVDGHTGTVIYRFQSERPFIKLDEEIRDCRIFRDGIHMLTECGVFTEFPVTEKCQFQ